MNAGDYAAERIFIMVLLLQPHPRSHLLSPKDRLRLPLCKPCEPRAKVCPAGISIAFALPLHNATRIHTELECVNNEIYIRLKHVEVLTKGGETRSPQLGKSINH